jgi:hypothetical protein
VQHSIGLQAAQLNEPGVFLHAAWSSQPALSLRHSSMSSHEPPLVFSPVQPLLHVQLYRADFVFGLQMPCSSPVDGDNWLF